MKVNLPLSIYSISALGKARVAYKEYAAIDIEKQNKNAYLTIAVNHEYTDAEKYEIEGSFLNYALQLTAVEFLELEVVQ
ncbi:hypothetical protein UB37_16080 [Photobacterium iliopiscarium]|jgi:hypothetical protein|uniref:Uncharacterized protein n=1 Tax=Photobacterium iliopiscarium TaxID=56192 RepID=A0ABX5GNG5_9GAMM|nr:MULTISPECIES: hypothetical protein [Photobacterium]KJG19949.1 hypothetical protein UB37_16080 [Photobacterium iliopiscarium]OBU47604.1 hypothetical protein AYY26_00935 [Photobacterium phosphoreum]PSW92630.1 hypothetical protein C9J52_17275 [Photobacterium iliopiscarium]